MPPLPSSDSSGVVHQITDDMVWRGRKRRNNDPGLWVTTKRNAQGRTTLVAALPNRSKAANRTTSRRSPSAPPTTHDTDRIFDAELEHAMMDFTLGDNETLLEDDCEELPEYLDLAAQKDGTGRKTKVCLR